MSTPRAEVTPLAERLVRTAMTVMREVTTTIHVVALFVLVELLIRPVRLDRLGRLLGCRLATSSPVGSPQIAVSALSRRSRRQARCTARVDRLWPFSSGPCLRRSLVLGHLMRHCDAAVRLGLRPVGDAVGAHAWVEIDGSPIEDVDAYIPFDVPARSGRR